MLRIRFTRTGKKKQPSFRIVVAEHARAVKGKYVEIVGHYKPTTENKEVVVDKDRVNYWISVGAQPTDSVASLLKKEGFDNMDKFITKPRNKKRRKKNAPEEEEAPAAEAAPAETAEA